MLVSLPSGVLETLRNMSDMAALPDSLFDRSAGYMAYCWSRDVDWPRRKSTGVSHNFRMREVSDDSCGTFLTCPCNVDGKPLNDRSVPLLPYVLYPGISRCY